MNEVLVSNLTDYLEDLGIPFTIKEEEQCVISAPIKISDEGLAVQGCQFLFRVYEDAIDISLYCVAYQPLNDTVETMKNTETFIGLINNVLYPGTSLMYFPGQLFKAFRYVDCYSTKEVPSEDKIKKSLNIVIEMYAIVMDMLIFVNHGDIDPVDAFNLMMKE